MVQFVLIDDYERINFYDVFKLDFNGVLFKYLHYVKLLVYKFIASI